MNYAHSEEERFIRATMRAVRKALDEFKDANDMALSEHLMDDDYALLRRRCSSAIRAAAWRFRP
jgi:hypothetical protein